MIDQIRCPDCHRNIIPATQSISKRRLPARGKASSKASLLLWFLNLIGHTKQIELYKLSCPLCHYSWIIQADKAHDLPGLESYYTDAEVLRKQFEELAEAPSLSRRVLIIHGVGGAGKSSLLWMFRLRCQHLDIPSAISSGNEVRTEVDILVQWAKGLAQADIHLPNFSTLLDQYRTIQLKVEQKAKTNIPETVGKTAANMVVQTATSFIPVFGVPLGILAGVGVDTFTDWLHSFLPEAQVNLLLNPVEKLTQSLLTELALIMSTLSQTHQGKRIVLMLDTFEQVLVFENWLCNLIQHIHPNILLVIAGRDVPHWNHLWPGWTSQTRFEELKTMGQDEMRHLAYNYYRVQCGQEPDAVQIEEIVSFARGLPLAITTAVQLWIQYGVENFHSVKPQVIADLANHLTIGIPETIRPVLKAAAILRWYNQELLNKVLGETISDNIYNELRKFPFIRSRIEGYVLHDIVREILEDTLFVNEPGRYHEMHSRARAYFMIQLGNNQEVVAEGPGLEYLYHSICADEQAGLQLFTELAETLSRNHLMNQLRNLLRDISTYPLRQRSSRLWLKYYHTRLRELEGREHDAEQTYQGVVEDKNAEVKLRAYALCDWGNLVRNPLVDRSTNPPEVDRPANPQKSAQLLEQGLELVPALDAKLTLALIELSDNYSRLGRWDDARNALGKAKDFCEGQHDHYGLAYICLRKCHLYFNEGDWAQGMLAQREGLAMTENLTDQRYLKAQLLGGCGIAWVSAGRYAQGERYMREAVSISKQLDYDRPSISFLRDLGALLVAQERYAEAELCFSDSLKILEIFPEYVGGFGMACLFRGIACLRTGELARAEEYIQQSQSIIHTIEQQHRFDAFFTLLPLGHLYEMRHEWERAEAHYQQWLAWNTIGRRYFVCGTLAGMARVKYAQGQYTAIPALLNQAEQLMARTPFADQLASFRLLQGHITWQGAIPDWDRGYAVASDYYQQALMYALSFNRYLLDEILSGRSQGTPLNAIIPHCLQNGPEGQQILQALLTWWQTGNYTFMQAEDISTSPKKVSLLNAERKARSQEPGDGSNQPTVVEQIEQALANCHTSGV